MTPVKDAAATPMEIRGKTEGKEGAAMMQEHTQATIVAAIESR